MSEVVGYKLVYTSNTDNVIRSWGGIWGQTPAIPSMVILPNGDQVQCPTVNTQYSDYTFIEWNMDKPAPTANDVWAEKDRRWSLGFDYDFGDERGVHRIGTTKKDIDDWFKVSQLSQTLLNLGQGNTEIEIVTDTGEANVTPTEWQSVVIATAQFQQPIFKAASDLIKIDPIPDDYANDSYWTTT